jgi:hypothetical protein
LLTDDEMCEGYLAPIIGLEITSGYENKTVYGPESDCSYYTDISKRAENKFIRLLAPIYRLFVSNAKTVIGHTI